MENLHPIIQHYTIKHDRKIKEICSPLADCLGISYFSTYTIDLEGNFTFLSNFPEQVDFYFSKQLYRTFPYFIHPDFLRSGCFLTAATPDPHYLEQIEKRFHLRDLFFILEKSGDCLQGTIFTSKDNISINRYLNNLEVLKSFASYFRKEAAPMIHKMRADGYNLLQAKGKAFLECPPDLMLRIHNQEAEAFLRRISPISPREQECLDLYRRGYTAKETARLLGLSHRTVEQHFENIKNKLNLFSKRELLQI